MFCRGLQLLTSRTVKGDLRRVVPEYHTVQGVLEQALRKVLQLNEVAVHNSSRTDSGVHALSSTVQFEVSDNDFSVSPFSPEKICMSLNYFLEKHQTDIRIQRVAEVPIEFNCRNAYSRTYNYRIALAKTNGNFNQHYKLIIERYACYLSELILCVADFENCYSFMKLSAFMPITELYKAQVVPQPFDVEAVQQACRVFLGKWNFRSFATFATTSIKGRGNREPLKEEDLIKTIFKFSFSKSKIDFENFDVPTYYYRDPACNKLDFYDFHVEGSGFLRRQV